MKKQLGVVTIVGYIDENGRVRK